jgi:hypothetical protein
MELHHRCITATPLPDAGAAILLQHLCRVSCVRGARINSGSEQAAQWRHARTRVVMQKIPSRSVELGVF